MEENAAVSNLGSMESDRIPASPELILNQGDPGDDTLRRFRYQITYAGILSTLMVGASNIEEVYCEHHEDILLKHSNGTFRGIQVKTKDIDSPPFTTEDEAITKSLKKFVNLNKKFPGKFQGFTILSNHGFDKTNPAKCLNTLIETVITEDLKILDKNTKFKRLITAIALDCNCDNECVIDTLKKVKPLTFCNLDDIHMKLINEIKSCGLLKGVTESKLSEIADLVVAKCLKASSLFVDGDKIIHSYVLGSGADEECKIAIDSKCIRKSDFTDWIEKQRTEPVTILLKDRTPISPTEGHRLLSKKMDAGGIDSDNIDLSKDFKFSFEQHAISWIYKNNNEENIDKYNQILIVTQNLCKEVYDEEGIAHRNDGGLPMLIKVRNKIRERREVDPSIFFDCTYEHILGAVGVLTEKCKVWWSPKFDTNNE